MYVGTCDLDPITQTLFTVTSHPYNMFICLSSHKQLNIRLTGTNISINRNRKTQKEILYCENGHIEYEIWIKNKKQHRIDGPACISYFESGQIQHVTWYKNGKHYRSDDAPADISYFINGQVRYEAWYINGKYHRSAAPAAISYFKNGEISSETWCKYGTIHRKRTFINGQIEDKEAMYKYGAFYRDRYFII